MLTISDENMFLLLQDRIDIVVTVAHEYIGQVALFILYLLLQTELAPQSRHTSGRGNHS